MTYLSTTAQHNTQNRIEINCTHREVYVPILEEDWDHEISQGLALADEIFKWLSEICKQCERKHAYSE